LRRGGGLPRLRRGADRKFSIAPSPNVSIYYAVKQYNLRYT
jgi:hypothetical protein